MPSYLRLVFTRVTTFALAGIDPQPVWVEVDVRPGLPGFTIVGLGDIAVREARERVRAAIQNSGFEFPQRRIVANLAPASVRKAGPSFDLALAAGVLAASGQLPAGPLECCALLGELALDGAVRPCRGALVAAEGARASGLARVLVPPALVPEAGLVDGIEVIAIEALRDLAAALDGHSAEVRRPPPPLPSAPQPDIADVRGQEVAVRALTIAAAGGHNLLLQGPPGAGKTMLARRLPGLLPPLSHAEAIEVTKIHSVAGRHEGRGLMERRPFRAPHHTISPIGLVGGRTPPVPGEASLAHHGVLFLDELSEFTRSSLEALRQPLEDGVVTIVRGQQAVVLPTVFMLVAATNPCPCGFAGTSGRCRCGESALARHARRLSGPLLDRLDLLVGVERPRGSLLAGSGGTSSADLRKQVEAAREIQRGRASGGAASCNARLAPADLRRLAELTSAAAALLTQAYEQGSLSARGHDRVLRVARTIADLDGASRVEPTHLHEALALRQAPAEPALAA